MSIEEIKLVDVEYIDGEFEFRRVTTIDYTFF